MAKVSGKHTDATAEEYFPEAVKHGAPAPTGDGGNQYTEQTPSDWVEEPTGFPPYWTPEEHAANFRAVPIMLDLRDIEFPRYVLRATTPVVCSKGPSDNQEEITVAPGELFTCSAYASLRLDQYLGHEVMVFSTEKRSLKGGKSLWQFRVFVAPQTRRLLDAERQAATRKQLDEARKTPIG